MFQVGLEGEDRDLLVVQVHYDRRFPLDRMTELLRLVNLHRVKFRWPTVVIHDVGGVLELKCEMQLDLSPGIHRRLLHEVIDSAFLYGHSFFLWLAKCLRGEPEPIELAFQDPGIGIWLGDLDELETPPDDAPGTGPG